MQGGLRRVCQSKLRTSGPKSGRIMALQLLMPLTIVFNIIIIVKNIEGGTCISSNPAECLYSAVSAYNICVGTCEANRGL